MQAEDHERKSSKRTQLGTAVFWIHGDESKQTKEKPNYRQVGSRSRSVVYVWDT